ncbi:hypothetical protein [Bernardetia sp.]|uniref:hypothetical protein n=1 Tax=Bernardetia sp. TaxID=1937974 RepID=UPI0025BA1915|nr:hypothetical protein [Bernardetia sp.]
MIEIIAKKGTELSEKELQQITNIAQKANPAFPDNYITHFHIERYNPIFYMHKLEGKTVAVQAFFNRKLKTSFHQKPLEIIFVSVVFKDTEADHYIKNFAKKGNILFLKRTLGQFWFLRKFLFIFQTYNPKAIERISPAFYEVYPKIDMPVSEKVYDFVRSFIDNHLKSDEIELSDYLIRKNKFDVPVPITEVWKSAYQSKSEKLNAFFMQHEIISKKNTSYFLEGRAVFFVGYYNFWKKLKQKFLPKL